MSRLARAAERNKWKNQILVPASRWSNTNAAGAEMYRSQLVFKDVAFDGSDADIQQTGSLPFSKQIFSHAIGLGRQARSAKKGPIPLKMDGFSWPSVATFGAI